MNSDSSLQMYDYNQSIWQALADWRIMSLRPAWLRKGEGGKEGEGEGKGGRQRKKE
jgi:hypothetical protein